MQAPEALYDCLKVVAELDLPLSGVSRLEMQRLAFLGCVLSLYSGKPAAEWGYRFARTDFGTPFSGEVSNGMDFLTSSGHLAEQTGRYRLTPSGSELRSALSGLASCSERDRFLEAACGSVLAVPPETIMRGLDNEPTTLSSEVRARGGALLEGPALHLLHEHFGSLVTVLGMQSSDLLTPSVLWLTTVAEEPISERATSRVIGHA